MVSGLDWSEVVIDRGMKMDALFAFDNAVEKLLAFLPIEPLPEQLAELRFLFEDGVRKLARSELDRARARLMAELRRSSP